MLIEKLIHVRMGGQQRLLRHSQLKAALLRRRAQQRHHFVCVAFGAVFEIVGLYAGYAAFKQILLAVYHHFKKLFTAGHGQARLNVVKHALLYYAVGRAVGIGFGIYAVLPHGILIYVHQLHGL